MKKLNSLFRNCLILIIISILFISANSTNSGSRHEYATVDTDPVAAGYWTTVIFPFDKKIEPNSMYFSARGTGVMMITVQFKAPGDTDWTDYLLVSMPRYYSGSIPLSTGADTNFYIPMATKYPWTLSGTYKDYDATDAIMSLGITRHPDSLTFDFIDDTRMPYTMVDSTVSFGKASFNYPWMIIRITKGSVTAGSFNYQLTKDIREVSQVPIPNTSVGLQWRVGVKSGEYISGSCTFGLSW